MAAPFISAAVSFGETKTDKNKMLIVYFSWSGNTRRLAQTIKDETGADILEVVPETAYPADYNQTVAIAKKEVDAKFLRPIKNAKAKLADYDVIFVGSPNWWGTISSPIRTFLTQNDFAGKKIVPFMTHEGSRMGRAESDIKKICANSTLLEALPVRGGSVGGAKKTVQNWLAKLGIAKK